jgi:DNA-binding MarR family transcriptional regulator
MTTTRPNRADALVALFDRIGALSRSPAFARVIQLDLGISHVKALRHIHEAGSITMKDLAERLGVTPPSLTAVSRRLERTGLIERVRHDEDSRIRILRLTAEGIELGMALRSQRSELMEQLLATLTDHEQQTLLDLLGRAVAAAEQLVGVTDGTDCMQKAQQGDPNGSGH